MSKVVSYPVAAIGFMLLAWSGILALEGWTEMKMQTGPLIVLVCAAVVAASGVFWHIHLSKAQTKPPHSDPSIPATPQGPSMKNSPNISAGGNITIGHIGDTIINQAMQPELKLSATKSIRNADGTSTLTTEAEIISPFPPGSMRLEAWAPGILSLDAAPQRIGMSMTGHSGVRSDHAFTTLVQPFGKYLIVVRTKEPTNVDLRYDFDK
jgi:hypothetical protein